VLVYLLVADKREKHSSLQPWQLLTLPLNTFNPSSAGLGPCLTKMSPAANRFMLMTVVFILNEALFSERLAEFGATFRV